MKRRFVESTIEARLAEANAALSEVVLREAAGYIDVIVRGGEIPLPLVGAVQILGLERSRAIIDSVAERAAGGLAGPRGARAGVALRAAGGREPRRLAADPGLDRLAGAGGADDRGGRPHAARRVRRRARRDRLADVRHAAARRRPAGARARGAGVRAARPRAGLAHGAADREGGAERPLRVRGDAADAVSGWPPSSGWTGAARRPGWPRSRAGRSASRRWAWRSAAWRARSASRRCWRSCWRCRSSSWRSCRRAAWRPRSTTRSTSSRRCSRSSRRCDALDGAINGGELLVPLVHLLALALAYGVVARIALRRFAP